MYAFRPTSNPVSSDSLSADLTQHSAYGKFTLDMIQATGLGGVPVAVSSMLGVTLTGNQFIEDGDDASITHGYSVAALLLFFTPLLMLHLISGVRLRWLNYLVFIIVLLIGLAAGFFDSTFSLSKLELELTPEAVEEFQHPSPNHWICCPCWSFIHMFISPRDPSRVLVR
jgi:hypothetical protein